MYPEEYSLFLRKRNALSEDDVNGDIVFAEDVNELQEAIERLERHIGIGEGSIHERLERLKGVGKLQAPTILRVQETALDGDMLTVSSKLMGYDSYVGNINPSIVNETGAGMAILDVDVIASSLSEVQTALSSARAQGVLRVYLEGIGELTRPEQQAVVQSAHEVGMSVIVDLSLADILDDTYDVTQNPYAEPMNILDGDTLVVDIVSTTASGIASAIQPYLAYRQTQGVLLWLKANGLSEASFERAQGLALLYGLDAVLYGDTGVTSIPDPFAWPSYLGDWRTESPLVFTKGTGIERRIQGGRIHLDLVTNQVTFPGLSLKGEDIVFSEDSIDGNVLRDQSVTKEKISSLDPEMVVEAVNNGVTKIPTNRIEDMTWDDLPGNIPSQNMRTNVILAINERAGIFGQPEAIVDAALATLDANKLTGHVMAERMQENVISAINSSVNGHIDVSRVDADTMNAIDFVTQNADIQSLIAVEGAIPDLETARLQSTVRFDAKDIFAQYIKTIQLETDSLKVQDAFIEDLISQKITVETLDAVMAHIGTADIDNLVAESIKAQIVKTELVTSLNSMVGTATIQGALIEDASIVDAKILNLDASKIQTGSIDTGLVTLDSPQGHLKIDGETIRIYDALDGQGQRRLRTLLGNTGEVVPGSYGLVVLGEDGTTRLYDNTGVYNAGLHDNAVSNEKLQDDSVDGRVIVAESILAEHVAAGEINASHIATGTIVAGSAIIAEGAIGSAQISELDGGKITANTIEGTSIKAGSIDANHLSIGFQSNQMKEGMDDFETFETGSTPVYVLTPGTTAVVSEDIRRQGTKSLRISGNTNPNTVFLHRELGPLSGVLPGREVIVSAYVYTTDVTGLDVVIGLRHETATLWSNPNNIKQSDGFIRIQYKVTVPTDVFRATVAIETRKANAPVYVDGVMLEEVDGNTEASVWVPASRTTITGDMISTGTINASKGITFQAGAVVIDENGVLLNGNGQYVQIDENGLTIDSGSLVITGGLSADQIQPELVTKWDSASTAIDSLVDENIITVYEKVGVEKEYERLRDKKDRLFSQATAWSEEGHVTISALVSKVAAVESYLYTENDLNNGTPILSTVGRTKDSTIDGAVFTIRFQEAYEAVLSAENHLDGIIEAKASETAQATTDLLNEIESFGDDGLLKRIERAGMRRRLVELIGEEPGETLPDVTSMDARSVGEYARTRQAAREAGVLTNDAAYTGLGSAWTTLSAYLNGLTQNGVSAWDVSDVNAATDLSINGETLRASWATFQDALWTLQSRTAKRVEEARTETEKYVSSYREQLVLNGFGDLKTNRNFAAFSFDYNEQVTGPGSFKRWSAGQTRTDEYITVEPERKYRLSLFFKSADTQYTNHIGLECYDVLGNYLGVRHLLRTAAGSTILPSTTSWVRYEGYIGGEGSVPGETTDSTFPTGTRLVRPWFDFNVGGGGRNNYIADVQFSLAHLEGGRDYNGLVFDPMNGMTITSAQNMVELNASNGLRIEKNTGGTTVFELDSNTGDLTITGNINMTGGQISWEQLNAPTAEQVGAATSADVDDAILNIKVGGRNLLVNSEREVIPLSEFLRHDDLAPIFDVYGLVEYTISFDIKVEDDSQNNTIQVYMQNGSGAKYSFSKHIIVGTEYERKYITVIPAIGDDSLTESHLAFYGIYDTGCIPHVKNVKVELGNKATDWTPAPEDIQGQLDDFGTLTDKVGTTTVINANMIQTGTVKGDYLDAKNLVVKNETNEDTLRIDNAGNVSIKGEVIITGGNAYTKDDVQAAMASVGDIQLTMKEGYSSYSVIAANNLYFHGFVWDVVSAQFVSADVDGKMLGPDNKTFVNLPKGRLNLSSGVPIDAKGYIIHDGSYWFVSYLEADKAWRKYNVGVSGHTTVYGFSADTIVIGELEM